jgi:hypothetical protein
MVVLPYDTPFELFQGIGYAVMEFLSKNAVLQGLQPVQVIACLYAHDYPECRIIYNIEFMFPGFFRIFNPPKEGFHYPGIYLDNFVWYCPVGVLMHGIDSPRVGCLDQAEGSFAIHITPIGEPLASVEVLYLQVFLVHLCHMLRGDLFRDIMAIHVNWHVVFPVRYSFRAKL